MLRKFRGTRIVFDPALPRYGWESWTVVKFTSDTLIDLTAREPF